MKEKRILVVAAHPDDEVLGCGGTIKKLVSEGYEAYTLILGEGATSRDKNRNEIKRKTEIAELKKLAQKANRLMGVKQVFFGGIPDNRFDTVPLLDMVKTIEDIKKRLRPAIVLTHFRNDLNIDHRIACQAVLTATRPMPGETVKEIYSFEVLSSTEWNYPVIFSPNVFYDITETIEAKIQAMSMYAPEIKEFPHPRSLEGIRLNAACRGMNIGLKYAEVFETVRVIK